MVVVYYENMPSNLHGSSVYAAECKCLPHGMFVGKDQLREDSGRSNGFLQNCWPYLERFD